ncbi:hypothetical protein F4777DRAFT_289046 [Nemania sp. FL0916]|nr:hypothetical protein F4777DRAFT_289046 [Nemania sp. FL0916]
MATWTRTGRTATDGWWRPGLKTNEYKTGEAHDSDEAYKKLAARWAVDEATLCAYPYLAHVKRLSETGWNHLRLLADFMSIGTVPQRWHDLDSGLEAAPLSSDEKFSREEARNERIERTHVSVLDYYSTEVKRKDFTSTQSLKDGLSNEDADDGLKFRLYVAEDLSRDVIENLGHTFGVEPDFFRAHIVNYAWHNVRDPWRNPPLLNIVSRHQNWMQLRYVSARYFDVDGDNPRHSDHGFRRADKESNNWNVLRRLDDDLSNKSFWDKQGAVVGLMRSTATFWLQPENSRKGAPVGILLLDPTTTEGVPLWRGRRTLWSLPPAYGQADTAPPPPQDRIFEDFIFWAQQKDFYPGDNTNSDSKMIIPVQILFHLVCSEWLTMSDYIKTRINQLDWEIVKPEFFGVGKKGVDNMLQKLHMWRRLVPLYREMVSDTIRQIDQFSNRIQSLTNLGDMPNGGPRASPATSASVGGRVPDQARPSLSSDYNPDFLLIQSQLEEYQHRIDQLTDVVTAVISIDNSRRGLQDNRNIGRLTWLATFFIPLSVISGILSMQSDVGEISRNTFTVYFATSLPLAVVIAIAALTLSIPRSETQRFLRGTIRASQLRWNSITQQLGI